MGRIEPDMRFVFLLYKLKVQEKERKSYITFGPQNEFQFQVTHKLNIEEELVGECSGDIKFYDITHFPNELKNA